MIAAARDKNRYKSCCLVGNGNCFFLLQRQGTQLLISFSVWSRRRKKNGAEERKKVRKKHWFLWNLKCSIKKMAFLGYQYYAVTDIFTRPQGWIFFRGKYFTAKFVHFKIFHLFIITSGVNLTFLFNILVCMFPFSSSTSVWVRQRVWIRIPRMMLSPPGAHLVFVSILS